MMNQNAVDLKAELEQRKLMEIQVAMEAENNRCNFARQYVFAMCTTNMPLDTWLTLDDHFNNGYAMAEQVDKLVEAKLKAVADALNPRVLS